MHDNYDGINPDAKKADIRHLGEGEQTLAEVRRHPFGIIIIYLQSIFALGLALFLIVFLLPSFNDFLGFSDATNNAIIGIFGLISLILVIIFLVLATWIYNSSKLIVTTRNVTYINQIGIFNRKISEIAMTNIEDVTSQKQGVFATIFNFGVLKIETAGEQNNFTYTYCVNPVLAAKIILDARESFLMGHGAE